MDLKNIEEAIYQFDNQRFSDFPVHMENHESLSISEQKLIKRIWEEASQFELWNNSNLNKGKKNALAYLKEHYTLNDKANEKLVRAISYEWL